MSIGYPTGESSFPEWAKNDVQDSISGQYNVARPTSSQKDNGLVYKERFGRQHLNWLGRMLYKWSKFLRNEVDNTNTNVSNLISQAGLMVPVGGIIPFVSFTPPSGFLLCDGSTFNGSTYPEL